MIALPLSIIFTTYLIVCFKYFEHFKIKSLHAIVINYIACAITGMLVSREIPTLSVIHKPWFPVAAILGCSFFTIFNLMSYVAQHIGLTVTSVASKLSMVIPVTVAIILYDQPLTPVKILAMILAIVAVIFTSIKKEEFQEAGSEKSLDQRETKLPVSTALFELALSFSIFIGSGLNDSLVNYATAKLMSLGEFNSFNTVIFGFASFSGIIVLLIQIIFMKEKVLLKEIVGGVLLGVPNYFSLLFLLQALSFPHWQSSIIFPVNNMGIVVLTAVCAMILFRERISKLNWIGMLIAISAISLLIFSQ